MRVCEHKSDLALLLLLVLITALLLLIKEFLAA